MVAPISRSHAKPGNSMFSLLDPPPPPGAYGHTISPMPARQRCIKWLLRKVFPACPIVLVGQGGPHVVDCRPCTNVVVVLRLDPGQSSRRGAKY
ncbi:hypothetical protein B0T18DRAFT_121673 [Schizothecium vesticola]|uniref:Uncharacterized protein n=1 Tax=Schizothecium vesticola TaxID=314040 RepID=A0AA40F2L1_9PEZI|nr:hypothetical protein B0T18DRAFT_121673 [Schizothecium vesticola]